MKSHFILSSGAAMACAVTGATALMTDACSAQTLSAADYATNSAYADGWQDTDNGGFGFSHWSFYGTYQSAIQHAMDTNSVYDQLGVAWTIFLPNGIPEGTSNPPEESMDLSRAGRGFSPLQVGQTITTVIDNPTERHFYKGYTIRLVSGGQNTGYCCPGAVSRLAVGTFEYGSFGRWYAGSGGGTTLFDTNTAAAGMRLAVTLTGPNNYLLTMTPLNNPANAYTNAGTLSGSGAIDWIQFEHYSTDSDFFPDPVPSDPKETDFYISSITITDVQPVPPAFIKQPTSQALYPGRTARFNASVLGSTLSYQWRKNGANLTNGGKTSGALTDTLVIGNVGTGDAAGYTLVVTNSAGAVTSAPPATLTLVQPSGTPYEAAVLAANPVAHWRLNEIANPATNPPAFDYIGGLAGYYGNASSNGFNGVLGPRPSDGFPAFETTNRAMQSTAGTPDSWVTVPPLNLNTNTVTLTAWIYPNGDQSGFCGLFYTRKDGVGAGMHYGGNCCGGTVATAGKLSYTWNANNQATWGFDSGLDIPPNQWSFVAAVIEPTQATLYLYNANGLASATNAIPHTVEPWNGDARIGNDPNGVGRTFDGKIDEVAVFNYTLTPAQILNLYYSMVLTIQRAGSNIVVTWPQGTLLEATNVTGPWITNNATSPYTNPPSGSRKFYRAVR